jgi:hypothetical protein
MANAETTTDRDKLRGERKLSLVGDADQGCHIDFLPSGTYGFTYSPSTEGVPVFAKSTFQAFEVHKLFNGAVHITGYMNAADAKAFESAKDTTELKLYPEPYQDANVFVSVPASRILKGKPTARENGNFMGFLCLPKES